MDRFGCRGTADERSDEDLVLSVDDDRYVALRLTAAALRARREIRCLLVGVDAAFLRLIHQEADRCGLGLGVHGAGNRAEVGAQVVSERDLDRGLTLVVTQVGRELVADAVPDR